LGPGGPKHTLVQADAGGQTTLVIIKDEKPQLISGKEKDETRKSGLHWGIGPDSRNLKDDMFPGHRPYFSHLFTDNAGRIYIVRGGSILEKDAPRKVDVFSKDGYYLYAMTWPIFPTAIKAGFFYQFREDKDSGEYQIIRHRIKNWSTMKTAGNS
jgi:hypothetical protein